MKKGFTLIELLVVIAIIALLSTLAVVALSSARLKSRDAKRLSDMKQLSTALELYFNDQGSYPVVASLVLGGASSGCLGAGGFAAAGGCTNPVYMAQVPANPTPGGAAYTYEGTASTFGISFELEGAAGGFGLGPHSATQNGLQ